MSRLILGVALLRIELVATYNNNDHDDDNDENNDILILIMMVMIIPCLNSDAESQLQREKLDWK